ncbi:hypothetical protein BC936DRAFT_139422 [Jimgerdemannia flammicorona]|uniref:Uncharacterized protein n=1 Tax=Jimgerdemannia flammicorona TaxID=994334 RepID=A0A433B9X9_9FUNG|nr:hypothetical protein BC936DRAFT_139422 [Jimgerdemannia flammicorona]
MDTTFDQSSSTSDTPDGFRTFGNRKYTPSENPKYVLPSGDDIEMDRLDYQHYIARHLMHGNFNAPVEDALESVNEILLARGVDEGMIQVLPKLLTAQGFEDIYSDFVSAPVGWNGRVGALMKTCLMNFWEVCRPMVMPKLGLDDGEYTDLYVRVVQQMTKAKTYMNIPYAYGRKPIA